jgi:hypothetical protein
MYCLCQPSVEPSFQIYMYLDLEMIILDTKINELSINQSTLGTNVVLPLTVIDCRPFNISSCRRYFDSNYM